MNKVVVMSVLLAAVLSACSNKQVKEPPAPAVVEKSPAVTKPAEPMAPAKDNSANTAPVIEQPMAVNPLKDPNNILSQRSIYFDYDKDEVKAEYRPLVEAHAKYLTAHPDAKIFLQGNTDERGAREYNLSLGQRRAVAVKKVLNLLGVADKQIETVSFGEEKAHTNCRDDSCFKQDRRADIVYESD